MQKGSDNENGIYFLRWDNRDFFLMSTFKKGIYLCICLSVLWVCLNLRYRYRKPQLRELSR